MTSAVGEFVTRDGARLGYVERGAGPPLVLLHGGATDHRCFDPVVGALAERFTVVAYDRRGHGLSASERRTTVAGDAADFLELAAAVGGDAGVCALGYSFGGLVALEAVAAAPEPPVHALVVYEPEE